MTPLQKYQGSNAALSLFNSFSLQEWRTVEQQPLFCPLTSPDVDKWAGQQSGAIFMYLQKLGVTYEYAFCL